LSRARRLKHDRWLLASYFGLALIALLIGRFGMDAGITLDEQLQVNYGDRVLAWFRSGFTDRRALDYRNLYLYGGWFDLPAQWITEHSPFGVYDTRHLLTACVAALGVVVTWQMAALLGGARAGLLSAAFLVLTPAWTGHGLFNPKDIPFGTAAAWAVYACLRLVLAKGALSWRDLLRAGMSIGLALGIRPGGVFLIGYFLLALGAHAWLEARASRHGAAATALGALAVRTAARATATLGLAWLVMLAAWPWAQVSPAWHPVRAAAAASRFAWRGNVLFDGQLISARQLPNNYLPTWFAITLPETYAIAVLSALSVAWVSRRHWLQHPRALLAIGLLCVSVIAPIAAVIVRHSVVYDAHRHVLFVLPPLAALAGVATSSCLFNPHIARLWRGLLAAVLLAISVVTAGDIVRLHPYEYTFFNRTFGGLHAAFGRYDTDYWGVSYREGLQWVFAHAPLEPGRKLGIDWCNDAVPLAYYLERAPWHRAHFEVRFPARRPRYWLGTTRDQCSVPPGTVVHRVIRDGVPLLLVVRLAGR
jgi:hypothetical protein